MTVELDPAQQVTISPEASGIFVIADIMAPGHVIEKDPVPLARIALAVPSTESVLSAMGGESDQFVPYVFEGSEEQGDTALTDGEQLDLADILGNGGAIRVLGHSNESATITSHTAPEQKDDESSLMTALRKTRVARTASTIGVAAVGLISLFGASSAKADTAPVRAGNVPGLTDGQNPFSDYEGASTATASDAEDASTGVSLTPAELQECVKIATTIVPGPKKSGYVMYRPGIRYGTTHRAYNQQTVVGEQYIEVLPDGSEPGEPNCADDIRVWEGGRLQMQNPHHRSAWLNLTRQPKFAWTDNPTGVDGIARVGIGAVRPLAWGPGSAWRYNQCPDGKHWLKVREETDLYAQDIQTGQFVDSHKYVSPVPIRGGSCAAAARSARVAAANWKAEVKGAN